MTDNMKNWLEALSKNTDLQTKCKELDNSDEKTTGKAIVKLANESGYPLTEADLQSTEILEEDNSMSDDELDAVVGGAGGGTYKKTFCNCACAFIGGGSGNDYKFFYNRGEITHARGEGDKVGCACVGYGEGGDARNDHTVCMCAVGGVGKSELEVPMDVVESGGLPPELQ